MGAGAGATVGKLFGIERAMKGGIGTASLRVGGVTVGALVAVNPVGDVIDPSTGTHAGRGAPRRRSGRGTACGCSGPSRGAAPVLRPRAAGRHGDDHRRWSRPTRSLDKAQARKLAQMSHDGLAR